MTSSSGHTQSGDVFGHDSWRAEVAEQFQTHYRSGLRLLFAGDEWRAQTLSFNCEHLYVDFSKQFVTVSLLESLIAGANGKGIPSQIASMMRGDAVNTTEQRAALHTALRDSSFATSQAHDAKDQLQKAVKVASRVRSSAVTDVVNIGIGGSDLGPLMAYHALRNFHSGPRVHFVSNIDPADLDSVLAKCAPESTIFVIVSKTFTTAETMSNAKRARKWLEDHGVPNDPQQFIACTSAPDVARQWGVDAEYIMEFASWVGGRFSLSSVAGLSLLIGIGENHFRDFLSGMHAVDTHFAETPLELNVPVLHGLIAFMNSSIANWSSWAVVPYSHDLSLLPAYLQQLIMESNGKSVMVDGTAVSYSTSPIVWGQAGTNGQHAFFQLLHQGSHTVPVDFIGFARTSGSDQEAHQELIANMVAQSRALAFGRTASEVEADGSAAQLISHRVSAGNKPSTTILATALEPRVLGEIISLYEHSTAVQGWMMGINSFDQWGVELGKTIARNVLTALQNSGGVSEFDSSTNELLQWYLDHRK